MFCTNCGANLPNDATFCTSCGAKLDGAKQQAPTNSGATSYAPTSQGAAPYTPVNQGATPYAPPVNQGAAAYAPVNQGNQPYGQTNAGNPYGANQGGYQNQPTYGRPQYTQNPQTKKILTIGGIIVAALFALIILVNVVKSATTPGYTKPLNYMVDGIESGKMSTLMKAFPDFMTKEMKKNLKYYTDDVDKYMEEYIVSTLEYQYGKGYKVSYKIEDKDQLSSKEIKTIEEDLEYDYDKKINIKEAYSLEVEMTIKGKEGKDTDTSYFTVVKIGNKWYCLENMFGF